MCICRWMNCVNIRMHGATIKKSFFLVVVMKQIIMPLVKKFLAGYVSWNSIRIFKRVRKWPVYWYRWIHFVSLYIYHTYLKYILLLSFHLLLGCALCISVPMCDACPTHLISFDFLTHVSKLPTSMQSVTVPATYERKREGKSSW